MSRYWPLSTPPLLTRVVASPSASITEAIRKFPLSLTRLAALGVAETTKVFCPIASRRGVTASTAARQSLADDEVFHYNNLIRYFAGLVVATITTRSLYSGQNV